MIKDKNQLICARARKNRVFKIMI